MMPEMKLGWLRQVVIHLAMMELVEIMLLKIMLMVVLVVAEPPLVIIITVEAEVEGVLAEVQAVQV